MSDDPISFRFQGLRQRLQSLQGEDSATRQNIEQALAELQQLYEDMQNTLQAARQSEQNLLQQNQQIQIIFQRYYKSFQASLQPMLLTDARGTILEANPAIAQLLNVSRSSLIGAPLGRYVVERDRAAFQAQLSQLSNQSSSQVWQLNLWGRGANSFAAELQILPLPGGADSPGLRIEVRRLNDGLGEDATPLTRSQSLSIINAKTMTPFPQSLDGLRVLLVDDETDAREFLTAVLEAHGVQVQAAANAAEALAVLEQFRPDVLVSDLRMQEMDGHSLIRQIRALESQRGGHLPAAAITAYLCEDPEVSTQAGFETHLHKLVTPAELLQVVAQLAGRAPAQDQNP